ncbi:MAG: DUF3667 domain-containing protein [Bacteroidales bacterium]|nr:DUF3667 domain-containing protein [Bacteroidales bacterium]
MNLKETLGRFRTWQNKPYHNSDEEQEEHRCANCGNVFRGNYCPVCRQDAKDGRITWKWVGKSILDVWGLDSRSLPNTLLQLFIRPGRIIGAYLDGQHQICYKPFNMLFILAIFYVVVQQLLGWDYAATPEDKGGKVVQMVFEWVSEHPAWNAMLISVAMIIPTWLFFRFAPRHTRHTLPEGIFIQLFMNILILVIVFLSDFFILLSLLIPVYYYIAYRQLFGYRPWGTIWRILLCFVVWGIFFVIFINLLNIVTTHPEKLPRVAIGLLLYLVALAGILAFGYFVSKKNAQSKT